jgi:hypothetical protein
MLKSLFNIEKLNTFHFVLLITVIVVFLPFILTRETFSFIDYNKTGGIGDTLGGITAPFINSLAALLVFWAYKEQRKANELLRNQQKLQFIQTEISRLEEMSDSNLFAGDIVKVGQQEKNVPLNEKTRINMTLYNNTKYLIQIFEHLINQLNNTNENTDFLKTKLKILYNAKYKEFMNILKPNTNFVKGIDDNIADDLRADKMISMITELNKKITEL